MKSRAGANKTVSDFVNSLINGDLVFIDCGANDGCSAIKYLNTHPSAKILSFEPNPILHEFHGVIPNKLVKSAVGTVSGPIELLVDSVDGDGSTIIKSKQVDATQQMTNEQCTKIEVECVNLSHVIARISKAGAVIDLKLDIEGAEYEVLSFLLDSGSMRRIRNLYCEFHWDRIGMEKCEHDRIVNVLNSTLDSPLKDWDAADWMMANLSGKAKRIMKRKRAKALSTIYFKRLFKSL